MNGNTQLMVISLVFILLRVTFRMAKKVEPGINITKMEQRNS